MVTVTVYKESKDTKAGIAMIKKDNENGGYNIVVSKIREDGLFHDTDIKVGQRVIMVNEIPIDAATMDVKQVIDMIKNVGPGDVTIVTASNEITTVVQKPTQDSKVGIVVVKDHEHNKIVVKRLVEGGLFGNANTKIQIGQQVVSINDIPILEDMSALDVVEMLKNAPAGDLKVVTSVSTSMAGTGAGAGSPAAAPGTTKVNFWYGTDVTINRTLPPSLTKYYTSSNMTEWTQFCDRVDGVLRVTVGSKSSSEADNGIKLGGIICIVVGIIVLVFVSLLIGIILIVIGLCCCGKGAAGDGSDGPLTVDAVTSCRLQLKALCEEMTAAATTKRLGLKYSLGTRNISQVKSTASAKERGLLAYIEITDTNYYTNSSGVPLGSAETTTTTNGGAVVAELVEEDEYV